VNFFVTYLIKDNSQMRLQESTLRDAQRGEKPVRTRDNTCKDAHSETESLLGPQVSYSVVQYSTSYNKKEESSVEWHTLPTEKSLSPHRT